MCSLMNGWLAHRVRIMFWVSFDCSEWSSHWNLLVRHQNASHPIWSGAIKRKFPSLGNDVNSGGESAAAELRDGDSQNFSRKRNWNQLDGIKYSWNIKRKHRFRNAKYINTISVGHNNYYRMYRMHHNETLNENWILWWKTCVMVYQIISSLCNGVSSNKQRV